MRPQGQTRRSKETQSLESEETTKMLAEKSLKDSSDDTVGNKYTNGVAES